MAYMDNSDNNSSLVQIVFFLMLTGATAIGVLFGFLIGRLNCPAETRVSERIDTVYHETVIRDTVILKEAATVRRDTVWLPKVQYEQAGPLAAAADTSLHRPSADSALVSIPIERKTFTGKWYEATVEGFNPNLVDIRIRQPYMVVTSTKTRTKHWAVAIGPQVGYGFTPAGPQPYAGIGFTFGYTF